MSAPRPVPVPDSQSAPYWEASARHTLALARCGRCAAFALPPDVTCPHCHATDPGFAYEPVSGRGTVRSWTVVRQSALPGLVGEVPFVLVDVELDEQAGLRMIGRLLDGPDSPLRVGDRVRAAFEDVTPNVSVPAFTFGGVAS
ncbi:Zn-ribbon domain-containing OB-fold protein [Streptomyces endophyticus]|uniref:OB-fold domain-containing protein n=1 Tax=Streptomyces endophyticus TaxID=714166 RepID=A0ABU6EWN0_9ACTN|nr:OB-fold domain-containing protein [Streptomyces endophyticus]MEB8336160.1 OB-fold domain-containing protein [Streptomyces endophyticus]